MASALFRTKSIDRLLAEHEGGEITLKRSLSATDELLARGFADVASFAGGMLAWAKAGHPVER